MPSGTWHNFFCSIPEWKGEFFKLFGVSLLFFSAVNILCISKFTVSGATNWATLTWNSLVTNFFIREWFSGLKKFPEEENYLDILKEAFRMFHGDEAGFQIKPNPKSVKLIVPTEIDDVFMAKRKNGFSNRSCEFFCVRRSAPPILCIPI